MLAGSGGAAPPGFRLPLSASVGLNPKKKNKNNNHLSSLIPQDLLSAHQPPKIPGTQVSPPLPFSLFYTYSFVCISSFFLKKLLLMTRRRLFLVWIWKLNMKSLNCIHCLFSFRMSHLYNYGLFEYITCEIYN